MDKLIAKVEMRYPHLVITEVLEANGIEFEDNGSSEIVLRKTGVYAIIGMIRTNCTDNSTISVTFEGGTTVFTGVGKGGAPVVRTDWSFVDYAVAGTRVRSFTGVWGAASQTSFDGQLVVALLAS